MDPSSVHTTSPSVEEDDEWDTEGFVIPSLGIEEEIAPNQSESLKPEEKPTLALKDKTEEKIYLGPHGAPPPQLKQQEPNPSSRKQRFKQKLKEADRKASGTGRENKVESLRELVGSGGKHNNQHMPKANAREWLDPHCHESQFERSRP